MSDKLTQFLGYLSSVFTTAVGVSATEAVQQWIMFALGIISFLITTAFTIWKWYRKATADGKITPDEVDELIDEIEENIKKDKE